MRKTVLQHSSIESKLTPALAQATPTVRGNSLHKGNVAVVDANVRQYPFKAGTREIACVENARGSR